MHFIFFSACHNWIRNKILMKLFPKSKISSNKKIKIFCKIFADFPILIIGSWYRLTLIETTRLERYRPIT